MKKVKFFLSLFSLVLLVAVLNFGAEAKADLVLLNGKIATVDKSDLIVQALAVRGDKILALGKDNQMRRYIASSTRVIDLQGKLAIPGFIDAHGHFPLSGTPKWSWT